MTAIKDLNPNFAAKAEQLSAIALELGHLTGDAIGLYTRFTQEYTDAKDLIQLLQETNRLNLMHAAGANNDLESYLAISGAANATTSPLWKDTPDLDADIALQQRVGEQFLEAPLTKPGANILLRANAYAPKITEHVVEGFIRRGENFDVVIDDDGDFQSRVINAAGEQGVKAIGQYLANRADRTEKALYIMADTGAESTKTDPQKGKVINAMTAPFSTKGRTIDNYFTLTRIPTPKDAEIDGMEYADYLQLFFELCDQPWHAVTAAQEKLIAQFDAAKELHITNADGTDITLNIEGQTFANSVVKKNIPGSEIFSAPRIDGVNGTLVSKGRFSYHGSEVMEDITLRFENGRVVEAQARVGNEALQKILNTDEGARGVGEIGIGTNPWLDRHVMNTLLVEKIGGSFHIALGACYDYDAYDGHPVNVKNGNASDIHWDLTTMLRGHGGRMYLDGKLIQKDGNFVDPDLAVFNKGWGALPEDQIPDYWKERLAEKAEEKKWARRIEKASQNTEQERGVA